MTDRQVTNKRQMYDMLSRGLFGNTIPQYFSVASWLASLDRLRYPAWGVRTLTPGGPCSLYCLTDEVERTAVAFRHAGHDINISCMIDAVCTVTLMADVYDSDKGLVVYGVERPARGDSWRKVMPRDGREWRGVAAHAILRAHLNANSLADWEALRERFPGHVVEMSAVEGCFGTVPGRNAVVWEVRVY